MIDIEANRRKFINDLRTNPDNLHQIFTGDLTDGYGGVCALGLACNSLGIDPTAPTVLVEGNVFTSPYVEVAEALGLYTSDSDPDRDFEEQRVDDIDRIWRWNDQARHSFANIADRCEKWWFGSEN